MTRWGGREPADWDLGLRSQTLCSKPMWACTGPALVLPTRAWGHGEDEEDDRHKPLSPVPSIMGSASWFLAAITVSTFLLFCDVHFLFHFSMSKLGTRLAI